MTIVNGQSLLQLSPIKGMEKTKKKKGGVSYGLAEAGYDIRIAQDVTFHPTELGWRGRIDGTPFKGRFTLASAIEEFDVPANLVGVVHDKSTWARQGLSVFNTVIEPGWQGFLTLELVYHREEPLHIPKGTGIAQVLFSRIEEAASYGGKYQNQENRPVEALFEKG